MASAATLKRRLEFDPLHSPLQKRRRCMLLTGSKQTPQSTVKNVSPKLTQESRGKLAGSAMLKRRLKFASSKNTPKRRRCISPTRPEQTPPSPFHNILPKLSQEQIAANISLEIQRLQRRRQLHYQRTSSPPPQEACSSSQSSTSLLSQNSLSPSKKDAPLFTFKQVTLICERMLKDRESQVREEYNLVLSNKLAEQYEAFLKFNFDMIHKRLADSPFSYIS